MFLFQLRHQPAKPGLPIVLLGHNQSIAWGITSSQTDTQDLFVETIDPATPKQYLTPD